MTLAAAAYQGGLLLSQGEQRRAHFDHFKRPARPVPAVRHPDARSLVADFAQTVGRRRRSAGRSCRWPRRASGRPGSACRSRWSSAARDAFCTSLDTAVALVEQCGEPNVGVCLDVFHYYKGPSKPEDLAG